MIKRLINWLDKSTCSFLAVDTIKSELLEKGFQELKQSQKWELKKGGKYFMVKNGSAIFAFVCGNHHSLENGVRIISAHSDSPCLKVKPNAEIYGEGGVVSVNVEKYGGPILYTWFDRPLSMSGRVALKSNDPLNPVVRVFDYKEQIATIPHLAIHFNRSVNEGNPISVQKDMKPVLGYFDYEFIKKSLKEGGIIKQILGKHLSVAPGDILDYEISFYPTIKAQLVGLNREYIQSGRIDDLSMAFAGLEALLETADVDCNQTRLLAVFDNEETGSGTKQGAASPVLRDLLERINLSLGGGEEEFLQGIDNTFMISADDAHAWHPNYNEKFDPTNHAVIGGGPVIKINANGKYMTDAVGSAVFQNLCDLAHVKCQYFVNHSDMAGGSTLGNIATSQLDIKGVDVGAPIWGMHSAIETAGVSDHLDFIKVFSTFFSI